MTSANESGGGPGHNPPGTAQDLARIGDQYLAELALLIHALPTARFLANGFLRAELVHSLQLEKHALTLSEWLAHELLGVELTAQQKQTAELVRALLRAYLYANQLARHALPFDFAPIVGLYQRVQSHLTPVAHFPLVQTLESIWQPTQKAHTLPALTRVAILYARLSATLPDELHFRLGTRLLIPVLLGQWRVMNEPFVGLSAYLLQHPEQDQAATQSLQLMRIDNDSAPFNAIFLTAMLSIVPRVMSQLTAILRQIDADRATLLTLNQGSLNAMRAFDYLLRRPVINVASVASGLGLSKPTANKSIAILRDRGILSEFTGRQRDRIFVYQKFIALFDSLDRMK